jgi:LysM repeat protein
MFVQDGVRLSFPRPRRGRGFGRVLLLATALMLATGKLVYGGAPAPADTVVVAPGDTLWSIAANRFSGDPRPHVDAILAANRLSTPILTPGQRLRVPRN